MELPSRKWTVGDSVLLVGLGLLVAGLGMGLNRQKGVNQKTEIIRISPTLGEVAPIEIWAQIGGEVIKPGVYKFQNQARVNDLLVAAGGLGAKADRDWVEQNINRAAHLVDGTKIVIPKPGDTVLPTGMVAGIQNQGKISLNQADAGKLDTLSGVGPVTAQKIIDYRLKNGGFKSVEEIKMVDGIGEVLWNKIKDQITL